MVTGKTPDVTLAQVLASLAAVLVQLVNFGLLSGRTEHLIVGLAGIILPGLWFAADAVIRHGRSRAMTPTASATVQVAPHTAPPA